MKKFYFLVLALIAVSCSTKEYTLEVAPPFNNVAVQFDEFELNASEENTVRLKSGSSINIPKNAFIDKNGNPVSGKVKIEYREFSNAADIISSGIPMVYQDENGKNQQMESAGMFEINGKAGNEEIFLAKDKKIQVNMASPVKGDYDFFYLEEEGRKMSNEAGLFSSAYGQSDQTGARKGRWVKLTNNVAEDKENLKELDGASFKLQFDTLKYPEVKALKEINWKLAINRHEFNPTIDQNKWVLDEKWERVEVNPAGRVMKINKVVQEGKDHLFVHQLQDSSKVIVSGDKALIFDFDGNKLTEIPKGEFLYLGEGFWGNKNQSLKDRLLIRSKENNGFFICDLNGKLIKKVEFSSFKGILGKTNFLFLHWSENGEKQFYFVTDKNGVILNKIEATRFQFKEENSFSIFTPTTLISEDDNFFAILSNEGLRVFDFNGKQLSTLPLKNGYERFQFAGYNNHILILGDNQALIWDWKSNNIIDFSADFKSEILSQDYLNFYLHPKEPFLIHENRKKDYFLIYNWLNQKLIKVPCSFKNEDGEGFYHTRFIAQNLISLKNNKSAKLWNLNGDILLNDNVNFYASRDESNLFISSKSRIEWRDSTFKMVRDFSKVDTNITHIYSHRSDLPVLTTTVNGEVVLYNKRGEKIKSLFLNTPTFAALMTSQDLLVTVSMNFELKIWDTTGTLISNFPRGIFNLEVPRYKNKFVVSEGSLLKFYEVLPEKAPSGSYQIILNSKDKSYITYAYLNKEDEVYLSEYQRLKNKEIKKESDRQTREVALIRSFEINNFGIYNWDRFYKMDDMIQVEADFDFGNAVTDRNDITVFLIAGQQQNTVIKYPKRDWSKFSFDPKAFNKILAILPEDRIAIFEESDFKNIDTAAIKASKKYQFKMRVLDKITSSDQLNQILKTPS